ncbi:MAG TPA: Ig-like domain-containing protein, partial [Burkholderiaceae bacterium]|nr:Ig-like domain-containing protein [Burkholderiaceae bacterium]
GIAAVVNGVATLDVNNLPPGSNVLTAVYQGDEYNALSTSATVTEVVTRAASATSESVTTLLASNASSLPGQPVTLTALVSGAVPSGFVEFYSGAQLLGRVALADGLASLSVSSFPTGTAQLTARYEGDTLNTASTSAAIGVTVLRTSTVGLGVSSSTAQLGAPVTLTANVNGAAPGGVVNFYRGTTLLGSAPVAGGVATLVVTTLPLGATAVNALYSGDGANIASTSGVATVNVTPASTTTTLTTSSAIVAATANLTLTAKVSGTGQAGGLVSFYNGATVIGTAAISGGVATLTVNNLPVGNASLSAAYAGDAGNTASTSAVVAETVTAANVTRTAVDASSTSATYGTSVTFTATISGAGTPGGTVTFYNGATAIGTASVSSGQATLTIATLPVGTASVTASYSGDASHATSSAPAVAVAVTRAPTQLALASSAATAAYGVPVTLTATLTGASPGGIVTFFSGQTALGTATVVGGQASLTVDTLAVGTQTLEATYAGDANNTTSVATLSQTVTTAPTATTLSASQTSARQGDPVVLTVQVAANAKSQPGGLVTFYNGATVLGTASVVNGFAAITVSNLPVGASVLTASYAGDARTAASTSSAMVETIAAAPQNTTTTLVSSDNNVAQWAPFTLTATVAGASPGGLVTFLNGQIVLGTASVNGSGVATLVTNIRTTGTWPITATYGGDAASATSVSSPVSVKIKNGALPPAPPALPATTTELTSSTASALRGDPVTLFARVTASGPGPVPTGTVSFFNGTTLIGSASLASGQAALTLTNLAVGADQIRAVYSGDSAAASSTSSILSENISLAPSTVTLVPSATTITQGTGLVLTARVAGNVAPGGTVTFYNGATAIATVAVVNGLASQTFTNLPVGTRTLTARYNGDSNNALATSSSSTVTVTAALATSTVGLSTTPNTVQVGQPLTLNATVSGASPTGTVSFFNGTTLLGSAVLTGGTAMLSVTSLPPGGASVTAVYSGDAANKAGASAASAENVTAASTTTTLAVSAPTAAYGSPVVLTATVSGTGSPAGTVNFFNGATLLGSATLTNGQASLSVSSLPAGTDSLRAVYVGNTANTTSASAVVNETITLAPTSVALASGAAIAPNGALTVLVSGVNPGGSVVFMSGQTVIGIAAVV